MSVTDELLKNNETYAASFKGGLPMPPAKKVAVVACMDARLHVSKILGLKEGDAHVIRNAGGVVSEITSRESTLILVLVFLAKRLDIPVHSITI